MVWGDETTAPYAVTIKGGGDEVEDAACRRGVGALINHGLTGASRNAEMVPQEHPVTHRKYVIFRATKNIRNRREILTDYGDDYRFDEPTHYETRNARRVLDDEI